jgi:4-oxalomesaconate tautomerase
MPWSAHPAMAVTGSQCLASCALTPGTVADGLLDRPSKGPAMVTLEHPMGLMEVLIDFELAGGQFVHRSAGLIRTCRKLAVGDLFVPASVWKGHT